MKLFKNLFFFPVMLGMFLLLTHCRSRPIGYGLLLWAEQEAGFHSGQIVPIIKQSQISKHYLVRVGEAKEFQELAFFRVRRYPTQTEAEEAARAYAPFVDLYGYAQKEGLPIREEPGTEAKRIYKLRLGQVIKILDREQERVEVSGYQDYWYRVLTDDGFEGYCYGAYLAAFSTQGDPFSEVEQLMARDPVLDRLLSRVWRPEYYLEMVERQRIDLSRFGSQIGLFPDRSGQELNLVTSNYQQRFRYEEVANIGANRYHFVGTDLRIHLVSPERMVLTFSRHGQMVSGVYVSFEQDIEEIVTAEKERRRELFEQFLRRGGVLNSTAYGDIRLDPGMRFSWRDFQKLTARAERIFLRPVQGSGRVDFPYYLSSRLSGQFDGIITFRFSEYSEREGTNFLYKFEGTGVRFVFIKPEDILDAEAIRVGITPLVIYFSFE